MCVERERERWRNREIIQESDTEKVRDGGRDSGGGRKYTSSTDSRIMDEIIPKSHEHYYLSLTSATRVTFGD